MADNVKVFLDAGLNVELDRLAWVLQDLVYRPELEPRRLELLSTLHAKGVKLRFSKNNPNTPNVTLPEYTAEDAAADRAARALRRKERGLR